MTRENKLALVIGFGLMLFVGILVSDHFSAQRFDPATVAEAQPKTAETEPVQLDAVGGDALVAGGINLGKDGVSTLPDAPEPGTLVFVDPAAPQEGLPVEIAKADGTPVKFHKVQKGETYWSIAAREYGDGSLATKLQDYNKAVSPDAAKLALNSDLRIPPIDVLKPGAVAKSAPQAGNSVARATPEPKAAARVAATVTVGKGDTAYGIAQKQGIKVAELLKHNGIKDPAALKPGQTLKIPTKG
jgi:nucleoid-associated protein YgaU